MGERNVLLLGGVAVTVVLAPYLLVIVRFAPPLANVVVLLLLPCVLIVTSTLPDSWWGRVIDRQSSPAGTFGTVRVTPRRVDCR